MKTTIKKALIELHAWRMIRVQKVTLNRKKVLTGKACQNSFQ